jgi:hypothetical protein
VNDRSPRSPYAIERVCGRLVGDNTIGPQQRTQGAKYLQENMIRFSG